MDDRVPGWMRWSLLGVKPPPPGSSRTDARRFVRDLQVRVAIVLAPLEVLLIAVGPPAWMLVVALGSYALLVLDAIYLTVRLRR
jgi:hypothetical protein